MFILSELVITLLEVCVSVAAAQNYCTNHKVLIMMKTFSRYDDTLLLSDLIRLSFFPHNNDKHHVM